MASVSPGRKFIVIGSEPLAFHVLSSAPGEPLQPAKSIPMNATATGYIFSSFP